MTRSSGPRPPLDRGVVAAIVLAVEATTPRPEPAPPPPATGWRFSGRWWNQPAPLRRERPRPRA